MSHKNPIHCACGTTLVVLASSDSVVASIDDLTYNLQDGIAIPFERNVRKIFVSDNIIIASTNLIKGRRGNPVVFEYELKDWVSEFIHRKRGAPDKHPVAIAESMHEKSRRTFKPLESLLKDGIWKNQIPGDRVVSYIVAGYPKNFGELYILEFGVEFNRDGNGLVYVPPERHPNEAVWFGEDAAIGRFLARDQAAVNIRESYLSDCRPRISQLAPDAPESIQENMALTSSLVKLESHFYPNKVGKGVNIAAIDRSRKRCYSITL
jgi:hypothetical protein